MSNIQNQFFKDQQLIKKKKKSNGNVLWKAGFNIIILLQIS